MLRSVGEMSKRSQSQLPRGGKRRSRTLGAVGSKVSGFESPNSSTLSLSLVSTGCR